MRDIRRPAQALDLLAEQDRHALPRFVRNRIIWQLDRIEALLDLRELDQACADIVSLADAMSACTPRVHRRFRAIALRLRSLPSTPSSSVALARLRSLNAALG